MTAGRCFQQLDDSHAELAELIATRLDTGVWDDTTGCDATEVTVTKGRRLP